MGTQAALTSFLSNAAVNVGVQPSSQEASPVTWKLSLDLIEVPPVTYVFHCSASLHP